MSKKKGRKPKYNIQVLLPYFQEVKAGFLNKSQASKKLGMPYQSFVDRYKKWIYELQPVKQESKVVKPFPENKSLAFQNIKQMQEKIKNLDDTQSIRKIQNALISWVEQYIDIVMSEFEVQKSEIEGKYRGKEKVSRLADFTKKNVNLRELKYIADTVSKSNSIIGLLNNEHISKKYNQITDSILDDLVKEHAK